MGKSISDRAAGRRTLAAILLIFAVLSLPYLLLPINPHYDERRYSYGAAHMITSGDYVVPRTHKGAVRLLKPPLTYYYVVAGFRTIGETQLAAKVLMTLSALLIVALTFALGRSIGATPFGAVLGAGMLGGHLVFFNTSNQHLPDMPLVLGTTVALLGASVVLRPGRAPAWAWYALFLGAAFAVLAKGLLAILLLVAVLVWGVIPRRDPRPAPPRGHAAIAGVLALVLAGSWFAAAYIRFPDEFVSQFFGDQVSRKAAFDPLRVLLNLRKTVSDLALYFLPGLLALAFAWRRRDSADPASTGRAFWMLVTWCAINLIVFALSRQLFQRYTLPAAPALAAICALAAGRIPVEELAHRLRVSGRLFLIVPVVAGVASGVIAWLLGRHGLAITAILMTILVAAVFWFVTRNRWGAIIGVMAVGPLFSVAQIPAYASLIFPTDGQIAADFEREHPLPPGGQYLIMDEGELLDHIGLQLGNITRLRYADSYRPARYTEVKRVYFADESHVAELEADGFAVEKRYFLAGLNLDFAGLMDALRHPDRERLAEKHGEPLFIATRD